MRLFALLASAALLAACAKSEQQPAADSGMAAAMMPASISVADVAGTWDVKGLNEAGDSTLATYVLTATADTTSWMAKFPDRDAMPVKIMSVSGDSIVTSMGPYESVLRKGVMVTTNAVMRLQDGKLVGTFDAHYTTTGPDSVLRGKVDATKQP
jgi:hypothetical protein